MSPPMTGMTCHPQCHPPNVTPPNVTPGRGDTSPGRQDMDHDNQPPINARQARIPGGDTPNTGQVDTTPPRRRGDTSLLVIAVIGVVLSMSTLAQGGLSAAVAAASLSTLAVAVTAAVYGRYTVSLVAAVVWAVLAGMAYGGVHTIVACLMVTAAIVAVVILVQAQRGRQSGAVTR